MAEYVKYNWNVGPKCHLGAYVTITYQILFKIGYDTIILDMQYMTLCLKN